MWCGVGSGVARWRSGEARLAYGGGVSRGAGGEQLAHGFVRARQCWRGCGLQQTLHAPSLARLRLRCGVDVVLFTPGPASQPATLLLLLAKQWRPTDRYASAADAAETLILALRSASCCTCSETRGGGCGFVQVLTRLNHLIHTHAHDGLRGVLDAYAALLTSLLLPFLHLVATCSSNIENTIPVSSESLPCYRTLRSSNSPRRPLGKLGS